MITPLTSLDYEHLTGRPAPTILRGWCWYENGQVTACLCFNSLGANDWATDGLIGQVPSELAAARLVNHTLDDLKSKQARIFIAFADLPGLRPAGNVVFFESQGRQGDITLANETALDNDHFADLVAETQKDCDDFKEIPSPQDTLSPFKGYGYHLWRKWDHCAVVLVNSIDSATCHLAYVGLIPQFRNKGHGYYLIEDALKLTGSQKILTAAVDDRNEAALKIYKKLDFKQTGQRPVRFRKLN